MAKRTASSDLNHDNWDREEEPETAGTFQKAATEVLKNRVFKVAKRKAAVPVDQEARPSAFQKFAGFTPGPSPGEPAAEDSFAFLASSKAKNPKVNGTPEATSPVHIDKMNIYYARIKGLNESVLEWIQQHVNTNPLINLQPVFKDYTVYFKEIEEMSEKPNHVPNAKNGSVPVFAVGASPKISFGSTSHQTGTFTFGGNSTASTTPMSSTKPTVSFASKTSSPAGTSAKPFASPTASSANNTPSPKPQSNVASPMSFVGASSLKTAPNFAKPFSFGANSKATSGFFASNSPSKEESSAKSFSFTSNTTDNSIKPTFSFGNTLPKPSTDSSVKPTSESADGDFYDEEAPKVEVNKVVEEGNIYTIRCKVFVKKDNKFGDRGVGNLYLKPVPNSKKVQLIVRAETSLGNLICNFILSEGIPIKRMGQKDVMLVCLATPETAPPPVPILFRVKSTEDAEELFKILQKHQK